MRLRRRWWAVLAAVAGVGAWIHPGIDLDTGARSAAQPGISTDSSVVMPTDNVEGPYPVTKVVDGDTIWVDRLGVRTKVRLTGLDTPEVRDPRKPVQCFGVEASEHAKQLLAGQQVYLERDPGQDSIDKYGRELAYVWTTSGALINLVMIAEGFGHEYTYDLPYKYQPQFRAAQAEARAGGRGLWSASTCAGDTRAVRDGGMR